MKIIEAIRRPSELKDIIYYTMVILLTNGSFTVITTIKNAIIGQVLTTVDLAVLLIAGNIIFICTSVTSFYVMGLLAQIARHLAKEEYEMVGKRINLTQVLAVVLSLFLVIVLWALRDPLINLYQPVQEVRDKLVPFYSFYLVVVVPFVVFGTWNAGAMIGLNGLLLRGVIEVVASGLDLGSLYLYLVHFKLGINSLVYAVITARTVSESIHFMYLYRPAHVKKFNMFSRSAWSFFSDLKFFKDFATDSGYLVGRGFLLLIPSFVAPLIGSRIGYIEMTAYTFLSGFLYYPYVICEALSIACNIKGSVHLGLKQYSKYRRLVKVGPMVTFAITIVFLLLFIFAKEPIYNLFTTDARVLAEMNNLTPDWIYLMAINSLAIIYEGLALAKQYFPLLFVILAVATVLWVPNVVLCVVYNDLSLLWIALLVWNWCRLLPMMIIMYWETWKEKDIPDAQWRKEDVEGEVEKMPILSGH